MPDFLSCLSFVLILYDFFRIIKYIKFMILISKSIYPTKDQVKYMLKEMKYVYEVYKKQSFTKAAESLYISQPALSATIKKLEKELGVSLFDRSTNPIHITPAGEYYIKSVEKIMAIEKDMHSYFDNLLDVTTGTLTIGTGNFFCSYPLSAHLESFTKHYPNVTLRLVEHNIPADMEEMLKNGEVDFALSCSSTVFQNYEKQFFSQDHLIVVVPEEYTINKHLTGFALTYQDIMNGKHIPSDCPTISLKSFDKLPFLSLQQGTDIYTKSQLMFQNENVAPQIYMYLDQPKTIYYMTYSGYGFSIINDALLYLDPPPKEAENKVVYYKLADPLSVRDAYFYFKGNHQLAPAASAFLKFTADAEQKNFSKIL